MRLLQCVQCARRDSRGERWYTFRNDLYRPFHSNGPRNGQDVGSARLPNDFHPASNREHGSTLPESQSRRTGTNGGPSPNRRRLTASSQSGKQKAPGTNSSGRLLFFNTRLRKGHPTLIQDLQIENFCFRLRASTNVISQQFPKLMVGGHGFSPVSVCSVGPH